MGNAKSGARKKYRMVPKWTEVAFETYRLEVPGGWLYRHRVGYRNSIPFEEVDHLGNHVVSIWSSSTFVPDPRSSIPESIKIR